MKKRWTLIGAVLIALLWTTQVVWGAGQKPLIVKQKASKYNHRIALCPILKDANQPVHIRYRGLDETTWTEHTFAPEDGESSHYNEGATRFELPVEEAGNYLIEYRAEELAGLKSENLSGYKYPITIVSWGDVVWGENVTYDFGEHLNILSNAGKPNLSQVKRLWHFANDEFNSTNLLGWDVSNVENISFRGASAFNQNLGTWKLKKCKTLDLCNTALSKENYSAALIAWAAQTDIANGVALDATGLTYNSQASAAREKLIKEKKWLINGDVLQTEEVLFQFFDAKKVLYTGSSEFSLIAKGVDLSSLRYEVAPEGLLSVSNKQERFRIERASSALGKCTLTAILPAKEGVHPELRTSCEIEVVQKSKPVLTVTSNGKIVYKKDGSPIPAEYYCDIQPGKNYEVTITSPDPNEVFTVSSFPSSEYSLSVKGRNTWALSCHNGWKDIEKSNHSSLRFESTYEEQYLEVQQPFVRVPHFLNLLTPQKGHNCYSSQEAEYSIVDGNEFLSVDAEGQLTSKKAGTAHLSVMFQGLPESKTIIAIRVFDKLPVYANGIELKEDKLPMVLNGVTKLSIPREFMEQYTASHMSVDYPEGVLRIRGDSYVLTDASAIGKKISVSCQGHGVNLERELTIEAVQDQKPLTAFEVLHNGKVISEGATLSIMYGESHVLSTRLSPAETLERVIEWSTEGEIVSLKEGMKISPRPGRYPITVKSLAHPELVRHFVIEVKSQAPTSIILQSDFSELGDEKIILVNQQSDIGVTFAPTNTYAELEYEVIQTETGSPVFQVEQEKKTEFLLSGQKEGKATLVIRTKDKKLEKRLLVKVLNDEPKYTLTIDNKTGLTVNTDRPLTQLSPTARVTLHFENPTMKGFKVTANNGAKVIARQKGFMYEVILAGADATVTIIEVPTFAVTLKKEGEGTLAIKDANALQKVMQGTELVVEVEREFGYSLTSLTVNGKDILKEKKFTVTENCEVKAVFTPNGETPDSGNSGGGNNGGGNNGGGNNGGTNPGGGNNGGGNNGGGNTPGGNTPPKDTAVEEVALATLTVAPNPFHAQLRISNPSGVTATYELVTLTGTVVRSGAVDGQDVLVDTETLPAGLYFMRLEASNSAKRTLKVIKY